jgi:transcriptional regulator with XRE-family HTH domain
VTKENPTGVHPLVRELRALRIRAGMTVTEVAKKGGVHVSTISEMEAGYYWPSVGSLESYAGAMNMKLALVGKGRQ